MDPRQPSYASLTGVLEAAPGLHVATSGGPGAFATLSVRGSSSQQVAYFLDGVPLRGDEFGAVNLNDLPLESLRRVEVFRGPAPFDLGGAALGGAVNLVSDTARTAAGRAALSRGSFGEHEETFGGSARLGALAAHVTLGHTGYTGDFSYLNNNGTPLNAVDDVTSARQNNDLDRWRGSLVGALGRVGLGVYALRSEQGLPSLDYVQTSRARLLTQRQVGRLYWPAVSNEGDRSGSAEAYYTRSVERFTDLHNDLHLGQIDSRSVNQDLGGTLKGRLRPAETLELRGMLQQRVEHWSPEILNRVTAPARGGNRAAGLGNAQLSWIPGALSLSLGARTEWFLDRGSFIGLPGRPAVSLPGAPDSRVLPSASLGVGIAGGLWLKADGGAYQRIPTLAERFGVEGIQVGSPTLRPERGENYDLGAAFAGGGGGVDLDGEAALFWSRVQDLISLRQNSQRTFIPENIDRARISGQELRLRLTCPGVARFEAAGTWLSARDDGAVPYYRGRQLPGRPEREIHAELAITALYIEPSVRVQYLSSNYRDRENSDAGFIPSRTLWGLELAHSFDGPGLRATFDIDNLTDRQVSDTYGYPLPGRTIHAGLAWYLSPGARGNGDTP